MTVSVRVKISQKQTSFQWWMMNCSIKAFGCKRCCCLKSASSDDIHFICRNKSLAVIKVSLLETVTCISIAFSCRASPWMLFVIYLFVWLFVCLFVFKKMLCWGISFAYSSWMCATLLKAMHCANVSNFNILDTKGSMHYESKDMASDFQMNTFPHFYIFYKQNLVPSTYFRYILRAWKIWNRNVTI